MPTASEKLTHLQGSWWRVGGLVLLAAVSFGGGFFFSNIFIFSNTAHDSRLQYLENDLIVCRRNLIAAQAERIKLSGENLREFTRCKLECQEELRGTRDGCLQTMDKILGLEHPIH